MVVDLVTVDAAAVVHRPSSARAEAEIQAGHVHSRDSELVVGVLAAGKAEVQRRAAEESQRAEVVRQRAEEVFFQVREQSRRIHESQEILRKRSQAEEQERWARELASLSTEQEAEWWHAVQMQREERRSNQGNARRRRGGSKGSASRKHSKDSRQCVGEANV